MRMSESIALDRNDVNLTEGILTIRQTKFSKSRLVPIHPSTQEVLQHYAILRDQTCTLLKIPSFFVSEHGIRLTLIGQIKQLKARQLNDFKHITALHPFNLFPVTGLFGVEVYLNGREICQDNFLIHAASLEKKFGLYLNICADEQYRSPLKIL